MPEHVLSGTFPSGDRFLDLESLERRSTRRRVICGCMFHREFAALDWRLHELEAVVDEFVVVESVLTHSGNHRELANPQQDPRFADIGDRLHVITIENPPAEADSWVRERSQREAIWTRGAAAISASDDDLIIISDADEVPFPETVEQLAFSVFENSIRARPHWFNFDWNTYLGAWPHDSIRFYPAGMLSRLTAEGRSAEIGDNSLPGRELRGLHGWHASWFGANDFILDKLASYAHAYDDKDIALALEGEAGIERRRRSGYDLYRERRTLQDTPRLPEHAHRMSGAGAVRTS